MAGQHERALNDVEFDWRNYGYGGVINHIRSTDFARLEGTTYLDHAGATLYAQSQLDSFYKDLSQNVYGNPHSHNASSRLTTDTVEQIRYRVLRHFNTTPEQHSVIFTSGCTGALKLLADSFEWSDEDGNTGCFCYLEDNHTSIIGMREIAAQKGASVVCQTLPEFAATLHSGINDNDLAPGSDSKKPKSLFAYAAQCNFSGRRNPVQWIDQIKNRHFQPAGNNGNWYVCLDAASFVMTSRLDLQSCRADFVTVSFYKMFGFPTGLGALIVRNDVADTLKKSYFGGGTVSVYIGKEMFHVPRPVIHDRFEDGTIAFLDIIALRHGFDVLDSIPGGMEGISKHTFSITSYVFRKMASYRHGNGTPVATLYQDTNFADVSIQGPIVNFNILKPDGTYVGYAEVDKLASLHDIHLRTGCFCNTGACRRYLDMTLEQLKQNFDAGHVCGDDFDLIDGQPTGSVRISFGYMSNYGDACKFLSFIEQCFVIRNCQDVPYQPSVSTSVESELGIIRRTLDDFKVTDGEVNNIAKDSSRDDECNKTSSSAMEARSCEQDNVGSVAMETEMPDRQRQTLVAMAMDNKMKDGEKKMKLTNIYLYPVKSCGAMEVSEWQTGPGGLLYDRTWMIVNESGVCLSQKRETKMCTINPFIDLVKLQLILRAEGMEPLRVPIYTENPSGQDRQLSMCQSKVCGDRIHGIDCGSQAADWISSYLRRACRLIQQDLDHSRLSKLKSVIDKKHSLSLANESQYLLINRISVRDLKHRIKEKYVAMDTREDNKPYLDTDFDVENLIGRFRGNLVIDGGMPYEEDNWIAVSVGDKVFKSVVLVVDARWCA
ncbi:molybdenum cofactor sulfurase-like [Ptychodera flava]|uniref:molybdenum cofactor sulfurase-like n=1 Tax=Ptychodera flava TaxID=63121 RepID=UPI00396A73F1